ncbi:MAG TPA: hypothetical protein VGG44_04015 [Tepidisphaeraceae bacterium]|jgi:hypothetical protein
MATTTEISLPEPATAIPDQLNPAHLIMGFFVLTTFIYCAATALQYLLLS